MTSTSSPPFAKIAESVQKINEALAETMDRCRRTVTLVLPHPTETLGHRATWFGEGWRVELVNDQIHVTGGCAIGETEQVAAAMLAADRLRAHHAAGEQETGRGGWPGMNTNNGTVYASIGNSDDKLSQIRWAAYLDDFLRVIRGTATAIHGVWYSAPASCYQNACVCFELDVASVAGLQADLAELRREYGQDSIAWAPIDQTIFI